MPPPQVPFGLNIELVIFAGIGGKHLYKQCGMAPTTTLKVATDVWNLRHGP